MTFAQQLYVKQCHHECDERMGSSVNGYTFSWHETNDDFLHWMIPTLVAPALMKGADDSLFKQLQEATEDWTDITLTIQVNGISIPVGPFVEGIETNMEHFTRQEARELIRASPRLRQLLERMEILGENLQAEVDSNLETLFGRPE